MIDLLLEVAQRDDRLYHSLLLKAERTGGGNVAKAFRRAIDDATRIHGFIDWREVGTFAGNIDQVADSLAELLKPDTAATLVELTEYKAGRRRYRELADAEWRKVKPHDGKDSYDARRSRITRIMEQLAEASGDVDELVAIKARDLSSGYRYLEVAEIWAKAKQPEGAGMGRAWSEGISGTARQSPARFPGGLPISSAGAMTRHCN